ncbi:Lacal_2735 family protein [Mesonia sp. K7]|uniref:Lacal_2735 family protein n=1 Tax=Mesonia sp. K7 TaxID=2218606 RepID=UPI000DA8B5E7|nr:Lacal_2735 family protein [Mesonia sp. K7]
MKMFDWFKKKNKLERLREKYKYLMKKSYRQALFNKKESDKTNRKARKILLELRKLELNSLH